MGNEHKEKLEYLRDSNAHLREENRNLKEQVLMFSMGMLDMEKQLETSSKLLPLLKRKFEEH
jgi:hypothetical protein